MENYSKEEKEDFRESFWEKSKIQWKLFICERDSHSPSSINLSKTLITTPGIFKSLNWSNPNL